MSRHGGGQSNGAVSQRMGGFMLRLPHSVLGGACGRRRCRHVVQRAGDEAKDWGQQLQRAASLAVQRARVQLIHACVCKAAHEGRRRRGRPQPAVHQRTNAVNASSSCKRCGAAMRGNSPSRSNLACPALWMTAMRWG